MLDEVSTLLNQFIKKWHFIRAAVPFDISILETADGKHRRVGVSWSGKTYIFIDPQKTKTLICWRLPYCSNVVDFILAVTLNSCKTVLRHTAQKKWRYSFYDTRDFIAADEWASYSPDLDPLDYCIWDILQGLVYEGRQLLFANLQDLKEAIKNNWKEVTTETVRKSIAQ